MAVVQWLLFDDGLRQTAVEGYRSEPQFRGRHRPLPAQVLTAILEPHPPPGSLQDTATPGHSSFHQSLLCSFGFCSVT